MNWKELRQQYPIFWYKSSTWRAVGDDLLLEWEMGAGDLIFKPNVTIYNGASGALRLPREELDNLTFHLGLADVFSYWKTTCSSKIQVSAGALDKWQLSWWKDLLVKGMGQYFFQNNIDFTDENFVEFESSGASGSNHLTPSPSKPGVLVPVGGGKDSAVTLELIKRASPEGKVGAFAMNVSYGSALLPAVNRLVDASGVSELVRIQRNLDSQLPDLTRDGFLNGHVPLSAYLAFLSVLTARLFGYGQVAFSNERSSDEANMEFLGRQINHQYSKTYEFEQKFRDYNQRYLTDVNYFSFLRPLYELQIVKLFSSMNKYFTLFRSCNVGYKNDSWCGRCPKCLSVFIALAPFMSEDMLVKIFGHNLLADDSLLGLMKSLLGHHSSKPFECVGTYDETLVALHLSVRKRSDEPLPPLLRWAQNELLSKRTDLDKMTTEFLSSWNNENNLPAELRNHLKKHYETL